MDLKFRNRPEAGELLAAKLARYTDRSDVLVLALPRGGVPVGARVAASLHLPLDVFVVRKLGLPGHPELAMGAIASGGVKVLNGYVIDGLRVTDEAINQVIAKECQELQRREQSYRDDLPPPEVAGKTVVLVDDGVATGSSMLAAVAALRQLQCAHIVLATPTISRSTYDDLRRAGHEVVAVIIADEFYGVGQWYEDFAQTSDEEVRELLATMKQRNAKHLKFAS